MGNTARLICVFSAWAAVNALRVFALRRLSGSVRVALAAASISIAPMPTAQATYCGPSPLGSPCAQAGIATLPSIEPSLNIGAGNPINLATGNKYQLEIDLPANPLYPGLEISRHYNAMDRRRSVLGVRWSLSWDTRLHFLAGRWQIVQADGSRIEIAGLSTPEPSASETSPWKLPSRAGFKPAALSTPPAEGRLTQHGDGWKWSWPNDTALYFDRDGLLSRIISTHAKVDIIRHRHGPLQGAISSISNAAGAALTFSYAIQGDRAYLSAIDTPQGRFRYQYEPETTKSAGMPRLSSVQRPDGMTRRYLYEAAYQSGNRHALTGIAIASADGLQVERLNTWHYDQFGRAIAWMRGGPDSPDRLRFDYVRVPLPGRDGMTRVLDGRGEPTTFHLGVRGGRHRLLQARGAPCQGCAAPASRAEYDAQGRLTYMNGTALQRDNNGRIMQLRPGHSGWPNLRLDYDAQGRRTAWASDITGLEHMRYDLAGHPALRQFANGDQWHYRFDHAGRPTEVLQSGGGGSQATRLQWKARLPTRIIHPEESESRRYDGFGRLVQRDVYRTATGAGRGLRYAERFDYDARHRLTRHHLPEGGFLAYAWGEGTQLTAITWHAADGGVHAVVGTPDRRSGYQYGNGLHLWTTATQARTMQLTLAAGALAASPSSNGQPGNASPLWSQTLHFNNDGTLRAEHLLSTDERYTAITYAYDDQQRLIGAQAKKSVSTERIQWYAWRESGALAAYRINDHSHAVDKNGTTVLPDIRRDKSGLPVRLGARELVYGPDRRLKRVTEAGATLAAYRHNAFGQRIHVHGKSHVTDYFYLDNRVAAEWRRPLSTGRHPARTTILSDSPVPADSTFSVSRRYIYAGDVVVAFIDYGHDNETSPDEGGTNKAALYFVHADLMGVPRLISDTKGAMRWRADFSPTGAATSIQGDMHFDLRLPGQVFDHDTGWHDNLLRTYLPEYGQYLEPDPLGPVPGNQALGYAAQQPRRYIDPLGLLLFAFDGTRNGPVNQSNVWIMSQRYQDGPAFYHSGPGNPYLLNWDAVTAYTAPTILNTQWQHLLGALEGASHQEVIPIDIIGFSRGAALARHFGNQINQHIQAGMFSYHDERRGPIIACVDLRFMGLFDTVAQFGLAGTQNNNYDLSIAAAWEWVAHAVALHERRWLFPLNTVGDKMNHNTVEAPFIGAHADIGGGVAYSDSDAHRSQGDISDVALNWMLWQARAASLRFTDGSAEHAEISEPILNDPRSPLARSIQDGDRHVDGADGLLLHNYQDEHARLGRATRERAERIIARREDWRRAEGSHVGSVDMGGYAHWLQTELGWQPMPS